MIIKGLRPNNPRAEFHFHCNSNPKGHLQDFPTAIIERKYVKNIELCWVCFANLLLFPNREVILCRLEYGVQFKAI